ncbi:MAG: PASTA domain-containing protein, partial [Dactylosporangium sp.]|nr:PASTA domain-containing protein [Dactylosporangium sp.]
VRAAPRRAAATQRNGPSWLERVRDLHRRMVAHPQGRVALLASFVAVVLLIAFGAWWFGFGRYTVAPDFVNLTKAQADQKAQAAGFTLRYDAGRYDEKIAKDTVLRQQPPARARIVKGGTITLTLSLGPERYQVPDVVGKSYELAVVDLEQRKLVPERRERYDDNMPAGNVLAVEPAANTEVKPGDKIVVWVSRGKAPITVPSVIGRNVDEARTVLQNMGLFVTVEERQSDKPKGQVLEQSPNDGAGVEPGATITLVVSSGPPQVQVPDVSSTRSLPCAEADAAIRGAGLTPSVLGNPAGIAVAQQPPSGTMVDPGSQVNIWCG